MKIYFLLFILAGLFAKDCEGSYLPCKIVCKEYDDYVLTHLLLTPAGPISTAYDPDGVYPYMSYCETSNRPVLKKYHFIVLENDQIKITICPDPGEK